jgi:hypothetical protein
MKKLIFLGRELDVNKEHELFPTNKTLGFDAIIVYKNGHGEVRHNLTEVHHLFKGHSFEAGIAFESDIHSTGGTARVHEIEIVIVVLATEKANEY